jgi:hypothetical protein
MNTNEVEWLRSLERYGVTGDLSLAMAKKSKDTSEANPSSVFSYAVWQACEELLSYLRDPQGISVEVGYEINSLVNQPLRELIDAGGLRGESKEAFIPLTQLLNGLHTFRSESR